MKPTKKNTNASSEKVKAKVRELASKKATKPKSSSKTRVASEKSTAAKGQSITRVEPLREGTVDMNKMPFESQANLIFNPLGGVDPKYVVGAKKTK